MTSEKICVATFGAPHGVKGEIKLKSHTEDPTSIFEFSSLCDADGMPVTLSRTGQFKGQFIVTVKGFESREDIARLTNRGLYVMREELPELPENEYYQADLIGLELVDQTGAVIGQVLAIHNFGAGDVIEYQKEDGTTDYLPFTGETIIDVDFVAGRIKVTLPDVIDAGDEK